MAFTVSNQTLVFFYAVFLGAALGVLFDVFRILRLAVKTAKWVMFLEDVVYFLIAAVISFFFLLYWCDGMIRGFVFIGEITGWILYHCTVGVLVIQAAQFIINIIKAILKWVFRFLINPFIRLYRFLHQKTAAVFVYIGTKFNKIKIKRKNSLKRDKKLLYNKKHKKHSSVKALKGKKRRSVKINEKKFDI